MSIKFARKFVKLYNKADKKVRIAFDERLELFLLDPYHPLLNNHKLTGKYAGYRSIDITGDWRALFSEYTVNKIIVFEIIGTHSQLYK